MKKKTLIILMIFVGLVFLSSCSENKEIGEENPPAEVISEDLEERFYAFLDRDPSFDPNNKKILVKKVGIIYENDAKGTKELDLCADAFYDGFHSYIEDEEGRLLNVDENTLCEMYFYFEDASYESVPLDVLLEELPTDEYGHFFVDIVIEGDYIKHIREQKPIEIMAEIYKTNDSNVINNGSTFIKYEDIVYYREYSNNSFDNSGIWGYRSVDLNGNSGISKLYPDGSTGTIWKGPGHFGLYIYADKDGVPKLLSSRKYGSHPWMEGYEMETEIFSLSLDGEVKDEYGKGDIFALDEKRGLLIITNAPEAIVVLDLETGKRIVVEESEFSPLYYDLTDGVVYYEEPYKLNYDDFQIFSYTVGGERKLIFSATKDELEELMYEKYLGDFNIYRTFRASGDYIFIQIGSYEGTGHMYCGSLGLKIRKDGSEYEPIYHNRLVDWYGLNKVFTYDKNSPFDYEAYGYYMFNEENLRYSLMVLDVEELDSLGLYTDNPYGDEKLLLIEDIHYVDGDTFFTVTTGIRDIKEDMGWRRAYKNIESKVYILKGENRKIDFLYSY